MKPNRFLALRAPGKFISTRWLLQSGLAIAFFFGMAQLLGLSRFTTFISGTPSDFGLFWTTFLGAGYMLLHFGFLLMTPIFLIAAVLVAAVNHFLCNRNSTPDTTPL